MDQFHFSRSVGPSAKTRIKIRTFEMSSMEYVGMTTADKRSNGSGWEKHLVLLSIDGACYCIGRSM